jgi:hypothetical protein
MMDNWMQEIGGLLGLIAVGLAGFGFYSRNKRQKIIDWPETTAEVTEYLGAYKQKYNEDSTSAIKWHEFKISYVVNGETVESEIKHHVKNKFRIGDRIPVKYDPSDPTKQYDHYNAQSPWAKGTAQFITAAALMVIGIIVFVLASPK